MKPSTVHFWFFLSLLSFVAALGPSDLGKLPKCAQTCFISLVPSSPCSPTDSVCLCTNAQLNHDVTECVVSTCTVRESLSTKNTTMTACGAPVRNRSSVIYYIATVLGPISFAVVLIRLLTKTPLVGGIFGWDDAWMVFALVVGAAFTTLNVLLAKHGLGRDSWTLSFDAITLNLKLYWALEMVYLILPPIIKQSILYFYLRIFPDRTFRRVTYVVMAANIATGIAFWAIATFQCRPVHFAWTGWDHTGEGECNNVNAEGWSTAGITMAFDLIITVLPLNELYKLKLSLKKKLQLISMFSVGIFVTIISAIRIQTLAHFANTTNQTYDYVPLAYWSMIEVYVGLICACMPAMRALYISVVRKNQPAESKIYGSGYADSYGYKKGGSFASDPKLSSVTPSHRNFSMRHPTQNAGFVELHDMEKGGAGPTRVEPAGVTTRIFSDTDDTRPLRDGSLRPRSSSEASPHRTLGPRSEITARSGNDRRGDGILKTKRVEVTTEPMQLGPSVRHALNRTLKNDRN